MTPEELHIFRRLIVLGTSAAFMSPPEMREIWGVTLKEARAVVARHAPASEASGS